MKKSMRTVILMTLVGIIAVLLVYGDRGPKEENELIVTEVVYNGEDITANVDLAQVAEVIGGAEIAKNKHENTGDALWVISFEMDGASWTMELGVSDGDIDIIYSSEGTRYKVKNGSDVMEKLAELLK